MSDGPAFQVRGDRPGLREATVSRRALFRAGLVGGASSLASRSVLGTSAVRAATAPAPAPGVYDLNSGWLFGGPYVSGSEQPGYADSGFARITLPHTVTPLSWGDWDAAAWEQLWIYRRHLAPGALDGTRVFVDFDGVMTSATVYLGGTEIASHSGGYLPWSVELTPHLNAGDNVLAVVVDGRWLQVPPDGNPAGAVSVDYLQPAGIYRDATLRVVPAVFVDDVFAKPVDVLRPTRTVAVQATLNAASLPPGPLSVTAELLDGSRRIASASEQVSVTAPGSTTAAVTISGIGPVTLWSPDTPKLYDVRVTLSGGRIAPHSRQVRIGFRQASFELDGLYLNGQRLEIFGLNRHQLFPYVGMAAPERLQRADAELLRTELHCNMVRCSHYPQSPHFLDACDELGLMVWQEPPGWQYVGDDAFQALVLQNVHDMIVRDRNRPSVIVWATRLNETANYPALYAQARRLADELDGSRQTTGAVDFHTTAGWAEDVFAYDDYHSSGDNAILEPPLPGVPYMVSEAVGALDGAPLYRWVDTEQVLALQAQMHAQVHDIAQSNPAYAGLLGWCGVDYASLNGGNRIWHNLKWPGVLDTFRVPKPGASFYRSQVGPAVAPVILPAFFWDFGPDSPASGPGSGALIATNCDRLELYLDGRHLATATPNRQAFPHLAHPPASVDLTVDGASRPELRIDGYVGAGLATSLRLASDPSGDRLALTVQDATITADGSDMTRFTFRSVDSYGNQRPYPQGDVTLALTGPGQLIAQNPFAFETFGGVGGGFIRSLPGRTGLVTVTATHPTLGRATGQVTVRPAVARVL